MKHPLISIAIAFTLLSTVGATTAFASDKSDEARIKDILEKVPRARAALVN